jgi:hybrid cluster-associated redox disulfide protein
MTLNSIEPHTTIEEIVREHPELIKILMDYGLQCVSCGEPLWGSLEENAREKGVKNLEVLIKKLNQTMKV